MYVKRYFIIILNVFLRFTVILIDTNGVISLFRFAIVCFQNLPVPFSLDPCSFFNCKFCFFSQSKIKHF